MSDGDTLLSTSSLFHYTYSYESLLSILKDGIKPKYSLESLSILKINDDLNDLAKELGISESRNEITDEIAIAMACFCDIPLNLISNHVSIYGKYSIGLTKDWGMNNSISPVFYIADRETRFFFELILRISHRLYPKIDSKIKNCEIPDLPIYSDIDNLLTVCRNLIMFVKPYQGPYERKHINFSEKNYRFYDEREWRYRPPDFLTSRTYLTKEEFKNKNLKKEKEKQLYNLTYRESDITHIILPKNDIEKLTIDISNIDYLKNISIEKIKALEEFTF